jgi:ABC-type Mn2+/Zn2+ transport system ATPase subunit
MPPPSIIIENAAFGYPGSVVLRNVSLTLPAGALVAITGDNGSGKSTLLHSLAALLPALGGTIRFVAPAAGATPAAIRPRMGFVSQFDALDDVYLFTGMEVVLAGVRMAGIPGMPLPRDARERAAAALRRVGAQEFAHGRFSEMSGGQRQRILLARALVLEPELLMLDEPVSGADTESRGLIAAFLEEQRDTGAMTILLSSHDLALVSRLATHRLHLANGGAELNKLA